MIIHKGNTHLVRALREQVKAQRELIAALEEYVKILKHIRYTPTINSGRRE